MAKIIILFRLKDGVSHDAFEAWTRETDYPTMRGVARVESFVKSRATHRLIGDGPPSVDYVEVFEVADLDGFMAEDMGGPVVQGIMGEFLAFAEAPEFLVAEDVA